VLAAKADNLKDFSAPTFFWPTNLAQVFENLAQFGEFGAIWRIWRIWRQF
jgi:hypothetical protein